MKISDKSIHLFFGEASGEGWHLVFTAEDSSDDLRVGSGRSTGKRGAAEEIAEIGRGRLESKIIFFMAVGAALLVEVLASCLLWCE